MGREVGSGHGEPPTLLDFKLGSLGSRFITTAIVSISVPIFQLEYTSLHLVEMPDLIKPFWCSHFQENLT